MTTEIALLESRDSHCDWCGEPFIDEEQPVPGYNGLPTHKKCRRFALRAQRVDRREIEDRPFEREPFNDWPNGQGTYD